MEELHEEVPSRSSAGVTRATRSAQGRSRINVYCQLSGLEDVEMNDFIKEDLIPDGDEQGATGFAILLDPVATGSRRPLKKLSKED